MDNFIKILRLVLIAFFLIFGIVFISIKGYRKELKNRNIVENLAVGAYELPSLLKVWVKSNFFEPDQAIAIEHEEGLYRIGEIPINSEINDNLYLLYYKYLGGSKGDVILQNIQTGEIEYSWQIPLDLIMEDLLSIDEKLKDDYFNDSIAINLTTRIKKNLSSIQVSAPIISNDSSLLFHCGTLGYLYKIDKSSRMLWKSKRLVHHSLEVDNLGNIWACSIDLKNETANYQKFRDDAILCLSPNGKEKLFISLTNVFKSNGLFNQLIASTAGYEQEYGLDPYHLNDILPINERGKYWDRGDLLLSLRHNSSIILYRPKVDSIIWYQRGPWLGQHDINIVNDSILSVFNNNVWLLNRKGSPEANLTSNIAFFDFSQNETTFKYNNIFTSPFQGRQTQISDNGLLIEETGKAKYYILDSIGTIKSKFYVPYYSDSSRAMNPTWSRVYIKDEGNFVIP